MSMEEFMNYNFDITWVTTQFLPGCTQNSTHRQRNNYGLIYYPEGGYVFHIVGGQTLRTTKNSILFLPKGISYDIEALEKQIPKKPTEYVAGRYCCPVCKAIRYPSAPYRESIHSLSDQAEGK